MWREETARTQLSIPEFSWQSTTKCTAKPVGKILHKLAIVFEAATAFKAAFYSLFNSNSPNFSEVKTHVCVPICLPLKNTLYSSLPSLRISFWAWADMQVKITHALRDVRDLRTSGNGCYKSPPFLRPRDQKKRWLWGREWYLLCSKHEAHTN